jgi:hypothetical protein
VRYKILTSQDAGALAAELTEVVSSRHPDRVLEVVNQVARSIASHGGGGDRELDLAAVERVAADLDARIANEAASIDPYHVEGAVSGAIYDALSDVPTEVLDDERFWSYLAARYFWRFILWREEKALQRGNIATYFKGSKRVESIPLRMYLRAQSVVCEDGSHDLGDAVDRGTDFWRSHVLRVRIGRARGLARSLAALQRDDRMSTKVLRQVAKRVNRLWANVMLYEYDESSARTLVMAIRREVDAIQERASQGVSSR